MRTLLATLAALLVIALLPSPAAAQQTGMVTVQLNAPEGALSEDQATLTFTGIVTLTVDSTAYTSLTGIPVTYTITHKPAWANVVVSPASDMFSLPFPALGVSMTVTKAITVTVSRAFDPLEDLTDQVHVTATTTPGFLGKSFEGRGATLVSYDAPEEPCPEHDIVTNADWASIAVEAADKYNEHQAREADEPEEVSVQTGGASPIKVPWYAVGGFALAGAGIGLLLRRRFA